MKKVIRSSLVFILNRLTYFYLRFLKVYHEQYLTQYYTKQTLKKAGRCGKFLRINGPIRISHPEYLALGNNVNMAGHCYFNTLGGLVIGDNTHISRNVTIYTSNHDFNGGAIPYDDEYLEKPVIVGRNVWIGMNVTIVPGVTIGEGAIIGIGALITRSVPAFAIVGSPPYRILKERDTSHYKRLVDSNQFGGVSGTIVRKEDYATYLMTGLEKAQKLFFVVGTGRCGSYTLSTTLSQHPGITCDQEIYPQLIRLSTEYAHRLKTEDEVSEELSALYRDNGFFPREDVFGEANLKLSNLISLMHGLLPEAKFIWLTRNSVDTVTSMYSRGWFSNAEYGFEENSETGNIPTYSARIYSKYRIDGSKVGVMSPEQWRTMSAFERNCWYWSYWNKMISEQLKVLDNNRWMQLNIEEIDDRLEDVCDFLRMDKFGFNSVEKNKANYELLKQTEWTEEMKSVHQKWCDPVGAELYK